METPVAARAPARNLIKPFPSFVAPTSVCVSRLYKNAVKQKCAQTPRACRPLTVACISTLSDYPVLSGSRNSRGPYREHAFSAGISLRQSSSTSSSFLGEEKEILTRKSYNSSTWSKSPLVPRAASRDVFGLRLPTITVKPEWWWRTLACVPYLIALQISDVGFYIQPFSERYKLFENLIFYVPGAITRLPSWFTMIYCFLAYIGIVKNKDWPHFRFHLMMGMLLETSLQIVWYTCNFMPLIHYDGTFGMQFWAGMGFAYIIVLLACVKSALAGSYVQLPVITEAAFIHTLFNIGSFHRPF